jgi:flagellar export protein FliJ
MFRFSLQPVLEHRQAIEQRRQRELAEALGRLEAARARRRQVEEETHRRLLQVREGQRKGIGFAQRELIEQWIVALRMDAVKIDASIHALEQEERKRRAALVEALKAQTILDRLREQEWRDWRLQETRAELKAFDAIAVRNYAVEHPREKHADPSERIAR